MARILVVSFSICPAPDRDGAELLNLLKALGSRQAVDALSVRGEGQPFVERVNRARMLRVPVGSGGLPSRIEAFRRAVRRQLEGADYDVVHLRGPCAAAVVLAELPAGARLLYEPACDAPFGEMADAVEEDEALSASLAGDETACLARADLVLVRSAPAERALSRTGLGARVEVVPPGVDVDRFDWEPAEEKEGPLRLLSVGRVAPGRGIEVLVAAAAELASRRAVRLSLAGAIEPAYRPALESLIAAAGRLEVALLGAIDPDDMPRVYAAADVCVVPSLPQAPARSDGPLALPECPLALLEAMACRRAIVAPRREEIADVLADGAGGLPFEPGEAVDLARVLETLAADAAHRAALAEAGYALVRRLYTASAVRRRLLEAYARLIPPAAWLPPQAFVALAGEAAQSALREVTARDPVHAAEPGSDETPLPFSPGPAGSVPRPDVVELVDAEPTAANPLPAAPPASGEKPGD